MEGRHPGAHMWYGTLPVTERVQRMGGDQGALQFERRQAWVWSYSLVGLQLKDV